MRASELHGRAVVTLEDANKIGYIDDVLFDPQLRQVLGFRVKKSALGGSEAVLRTNVSAVGPDAITVPGANVLNMEARFQELTGALTQKQAHGTRVVSEGGEVVGTVDDLELDSGAQAVVAYFLAGSLWERMRHQETKISAQQVLQIGSGGIMTVPNEVADEMRPAQK